MGYSKRYDGFDILKTICTFLVICIHAPFAGTFGRYFIALSRVSVPLFFMISGYFFESIILQRKEWKFIKKLLFLLILSNLLYFFYNAAILIIKRNIDAVIHELHFVKALLKFVFLNESPFSYHLWYLGAILYVYLIAVCCKKNPFLNQITRKVLPVLIPVLLLGDLILGKYSLLLFHREFPYIIVRNFLFVGIPYFSIGVIMEKKKNFVSQIRKRKIMLLFLIILFSLTTILERWILASSDLNSTRDHYISTTFLSITLFIVFSDYSWNERRLKIPKDIGRKYTTMIYIIHPLIISTFGRVLGVFNLYILIKPVIVFLLALLFSIAYYLVCGLFINRKEETAKI